MSAAKRFKRRKLYEKLRRVSTNARRDSREDFREEEDVAGEPDWASDGLRNFLFGPSGSARFADHYADCTLAWDGDGDARFDVDEVAWRDGPNALRAPDGNRRDDETIRARAVPARPASAESAPNPAGDHPEADKIGQGRVLDFLAFRRGIGGGDSGDGGTRSSDDPRVDQTGDAEAATLLARWRALKGAPKERKQRKRKEREVVQFSPDWLAELRRMANPMMRGCTYDEKEDAISRAVEIAMERHAKNQECPLSYLCGVLRVSRARIKGTEIGKKGAELRLYSSKTDDPQRQFDWLAFQGKFTGARQELHVMATQALAQCLALPRKYKAVLLRRADGANPLEISTELQIPVHEVMSRLVAARKMLVGGYL